MKMMEEEVNLLFFQIFDKTISGDVTLSLSSKAK